MRITKALITAANPNQRALPLQTLIDQNGEPKSVLAVLVTHVLSAGVDDVAVVICPEDEAPYRAVLGDLARNVTFIPQSEPLGYADAILRARSFTGRDPFLHLVGDHIYVSRSHQNCARRLIDVAQALSAPISAVQLTRETLLRNFGAVGGRRAPERPGLYRVDVVLEKPTPTQAEQSLLVAGLRAGHYLCFFGMHALTPEVMDILDAQQRSPGDRRPTLSSALAELSRRSDYFALEDPDARYDLGDRYGLFAAQFALALAGRDRSLILARVLDLVAQYEPAADREAAGVTA